MKRKAKGPGGAEGALLRLVAGLGEGDAAVERAAKLPQGFLGKAKKGERSGSRATASWAALRSLLVERLGKAEVDAAVKATAQAFSSETPACSREKQAAGKGVPGGNGFSTSSGDDLAAALLAAEDAGALYGVEQRVAADLAAGRIEPRVCRELISAATEMRRTLEVRDAERARAELMELEVLTLEEAAALVVLRAKDSKPASKPGEYVGPPAAAGASP